MDFDFKAFMSNVDPTVNYQFKRLTGGVINVTVRGMADGESSTDLGNFPGRKSVILKHAPPFIAGVGENAPMSRIRQEQTIEAQALSYFLENTPYSLYQIVSSSGVRVPELLLHDLQQHVLVISDLGTLPNLSDVFSGLGGYTPGNPALPTSQHSMLGHILSTDEAEYYRKIGSILGNFFAQLHSSQTHSTVMSSKPREELLSNPEMRLMVLQHAIQPIRGKLLEYPDLVDPEDAETLYAALEQDFLRQTPQEEQSFILGDCWTGAILVDADPPNLSKPHAGVIDWEFANVGRGANGDISQFVSHLELFRIAADYRASVGVVEGHSQALDALMDGLVTRYLEGYQEFCKTRPPDLRFRQMRSAFFSHGAELINCAFWKVWECNEEACNTGDKSNTANSCSLVRRMVEFGIWYIRHAGKTWEEFSSEKNYNDIKIEHEKLKARSRKSLLDVFEW